MDHRDMTGITAALAALALAIGGWMITPSQTVSRGDMPTLARGDTPTLAWAMPAPPDEARGLDRWLDRLAEQQLARN